jgi:hypothetical protein
LSANQNQSRVLNSELEIRLMRLEATNRDERDVLQGDPVKGWRPLIHEGGEGELRGNALDHDNRQCLVGIPAGKQDEETQKARSSRP